MHAAAAGLSFVLAFALCLLAGALCCPKPSCHTYNATDPSFHSLIVVHVGNSWFLVKSQIAHYMHMHSVTMDHAGTMGCLFQHASTV